MNCIKIDGIQEDRQLIQKGTETINVCNACRERKIRLKENDDTILSKGVSWCTDFDDGPGAICTQSLKTKRNIENISGAYKNEQQHQQKQYKKKPRVF